MRQLTSFAKVNNNFSFELLTCLCTSPDERNMYTTLASAQVYYLSKLIINILGNNNLEYLLIFINNIKKCDSRINISILSRNI